MARPDVIEGGSVLINSCQRSPGFTFTRHWSLRLRSPKKERSILAVSNLGAFTGGSASFDANLSQVWSQLNTILLTFQNQGSV